MNRSKPSRKGIATVRGERLYASLSDQLQAFISRGIPNESGCLVYPTVRRAVCVNVQGHQKSFGQWLLMARYGINDKNIVARHTCDNSRCVNPEHIVVGTQHDNIQDLVKRGNPNRILRGEGRSKKLTEEQVVNMRQLYATHAYTRMQIAEMFGVGFGSLHWYLNNYPLSASA